MSGECQTTTYSRYAGIVSDHDVLSFSTAPGAVSFTFVRTSVVTSGIAIGFAAPPRMRLNHVYFTVDVPATRQTISRRPPWPWQRHEVDRRRRWREKERSSEPHGCHSHPPRSPRGRCCPRRPSRPSDCTPTLREVDHSTTSHVGRRDRCD